MVSKEKPELEVNQNHHEKDDQVKAVSYDKQEETAALPEGEHFTSNNEKNKINEKDYSKSARRKNSSAFHTMLTSALSQESTSRLNEEKAVEIEEKLRSLVSAFSNRVKQTKAEIKRPPTPSSEESDSDVSSAPEQQGSTINRFQVLDPGSGDTSRKTSIANLNCCSLCCRKLRKVCNVLRCNYILDPQGRTYVGWLVIVSVIFLYNAWSIPLRSVFPYQTENNVEIWFQIDCIGDLIYLLDILLFKSHYKFIKDGFWVKEAKETWSDYIHSRIFYIDLASLFPLDIFFAYYYNNIPWLRLPRLIKITTFWELFRRLDNVLASPHAARITRTIIYMLYMIHLNAAAYYALSKWEGINTTEWTYDGEGNAYIRCFYFATKTATSIGKNPKPGNETEYLFMTVAWLSGVFVFAVLIGQVRDIVATATKALTDYQFITGATVNYLHRFDVPTHLQDRVKLWLTYTWEQQKTLDEGKILAYLPQKMQADMALHVHIETLSKVKLFHNCEPAFLRDLVVKLRSVIFLPGDYVCKKGEVGKEMYIVKTGRVNVIGGATGNQVLATLGEGSAFGEIALLAIGGMTKRTADVRAGGFANLFVLSKADLNQAIKDYPLAQAILRRKAKKLIKESIKKQKEEKLKTEGLKKFFQSLDEDENKIIIKDKQPTPKFVTTVLKAVGPKSMTAKYIKFGSKASSMDIPDADEMESYPPSPYLPASTGHLSQTVSISYMSDSSGELDFIPETKPQDSQSVLDVWRDDDSDDVFFRRGSIARIIDQRLKEEDDLLMRSDSSSSISICAIPEDPEIPFEAGQPVIPQFIVHPSSPNHSEVSAESGTPNPLLETDNTCQSLEEIPSLQERTLRLQRQISVHGDNKENDSCKTDSN